MEEFKKIVILFSGGLDSTVLVHMAVNNGYKDIHLLTFDYGQRHRREMDCSLSLCNKLRKMGLQLTRKIFDLDFLPDITTGSSLTNYSIENPNIKEMAGDAQPVSYVPFRNQLFLTIAAAYAETNRIATIWYGAAQADSLAGYFDGSEEWLAAINTAISFNRKAKIIVEAPLIIMSKADIVTEGVRLKVNFKETWTCYSNRPDGLADADTPSSSLRLRGFLESGWIDPIQYVQQEKLNVLYVENGCKSIV